MPLPTPILDDRSYLQLRDELVRRIPTYAPEWTDHNPGDPGIALIELFASLGENLLYRFNQIPETTYLAYLRLLQVRMRPAAPSRALVAMTTESPAGVLVPLGTVLKAGDVPFESVDEARAWPVGCLAVAKSRAAAPDPTTEPEVHEYAVRAIDALGGLNANQTPAYFQNATLPPDGSRPAVDFGATVDGTLWVAVLDGKGTDLGKMLGERLNLGFVPDLVALPAAEVLACPGAGTLDAGPAVEWQISTPGKEGAPVYRPLQIDGDTTRGLTRQGVVRLRLPASLSDVGVPPLDDPDLRGTGDYPPALEPEEIQVVPDAKQVLFWLRAFRPDGSRFGKVRLVAVNAVEAVQMRKARLEFLGVGNGQPNQRFRLANRPLLPDRVALDVEETPGTWARWAEVDGFHASGESDRHFVTDAEAGEVAFGTTLQGYAPQLGQRIRVVEYRYGGGPAGNVAPGAITKAEGVAGVKASNPLRATGGAPAERFDEALVRIPGELRRRDRAVTAGDFRELALMTPGGAIGRAECLPRFHPPTRTENAAGVVSVVVWPREDPQHPNAPLPDRAQLRAVCCYLDERRLVTTELYVIPPTYRRVAVSIGLRAKPGYGIDAVRHWVELVVRQYLAPLPPYGPFGEGWPLGRQVIGPELQAAALQVEGVRFVVDLALAGWDAAEGKWVAGDVTLGPDEVPELAAITVVDGPALEPGAEVGPPPPDATPVPVPIVREKC